PPGCTVARTCEVSRTKVFPERHRNFFLRSTLKTVVRVACLCERPGYLTARKPRGFVAPRARQCKNAAAHTGTATPIGGLCVDFFLQPIEGLVQGRTMRVGDSESRTN